MKINASTVVGVAVIAILFVGLYMGVVTIDFSGGGVTPPGGDDVITPDTEFSKFSVKAVELDKTATAVTGATVRIWYDENADGVMQYSELSDVSESSGTYTSNLEFPIGDFPIWLQLDTSTHQVTYLKVQMSGVRNSDGSAKTIPNLEVIATDDAGSWNGYANGVAFDTTDYNYTLSGTSGTLTVEMILAAADDGISSQIWQGINYEKVYGIDRAYPYHIKWDSITAGPGDTIAVHEDSILAATYFAAYCTVQDKLDFAIDTGDFDYVYTDSVNFYFINFLDGAHDVNNDWMYNSVDTSAPRPSFSFDFGAITAAGTFAATYGIGVWQDITFSDMLAGSWTKGTTGALGTCGDGFAWAA